MCQIQIQILIDLYFESSHRYLNRHYRLLCDLSRRNVHGLDFDAVSFLDIMQVTLSIFIFYILTNYVTGDHITKNRKIVNTQKLLVGSLQNLVYKQFNVKSYLYVNLVEFGW